MSTERERRASGAKYLILGAIIGFFFIVGMVTAPFTTRVQAHPIAVQPSAEATATETPIPPTSTSVPLQAENILWGETTVTTQTTIIMPEVTVSQSIPDGSSAGVSSAFDTLHTASLVSVEVLVAVTHPNLNELTLELVHNPTGRTVALSQLGSYELSDGLLRFETDQYLGQPAEGTWTLRLVDDSETQNGTFESWQVVFRAMPQQIFLPTITKRFEQELPAPIIDGYRVFYRLVWRPNDPQGVGVAQLITPPLPTLVGTPLPGTGTPKVTVTPTPTTPSVTPTPIPFTDNNSFEQQSFRWRTFSLRGFEVFFTDDTEPISLPFAAFEGDWAVWLGGAPSEITYIEADFNVPPEAPYLAHKYYAQSYDPVCVSQLFSAGTIREQFLNANANSLNNLRGDVFGVVIFVNGVADGFSLSDLCGTENSGGWGDVVYGTQGYSGQLVTIRFKVIQDSQATSSYFIDNVEFRQNFTNNTGGTTALRQVELRPVSEAPDWLVSPDEKAKAEAMKHVPTPHPDFLK